MKRRSIWLAGAALSFAMAAGAQEASTLRFSWWGGGARHDATLKAIAAFEAKNPGVKIKAEYMGFNGYLERLSTQYAGGTEPDIMQINWAWLSTFSKTGDGFLDLNKHKSLIGLNQFSEADLQTGVVNKNSMPCRCPIPHASCFGIAPRMSVRDSKCLRPGMIYLLPDRCSSKSSATKPSPLMVSCTT